MAETDQTTDNPPAEDWRGEYAEPLSKFETPQALGKSYIELEKAMSSRVKIPDGDDPEAWSKFYDQVRPESADKYEITAGEGKEVDENFAKTIKEAAYQAGMTPKQLELLVGAYNGYANATEETTKADIEKLNNERWTNLKVQWGETKTKENIELAKRAVRDFGDEELSEVLSDETIESDPKFVAFISHLMRKTLDDKLIKGDAADEAEWKPDYPDSPEMYAQGESEDSKRAKAWFEKRGHKYN